MLSPPKKFAIIRSIPAKRIIVFDTISLNCEVSACYLPIRVLLLPSGIVPGGCFPRARPQPPRKQNYFLEKGKHLFCVRCSSRKLSLSSRKRSEEHTSELQSRFDLVCRLLLEKK